MSSARARSECSSGTPAVNRDAQGDAETTVAGPSKIGMALPATTWRIRTVSGGDQEWDWDEGPPQPRTLAPARRTTADSMSRHTPVRMMCQTTGTFLMLDSGLEYELARVLDRDPSVVWLTAQPLQLAFNGGPRHTPDLLAEHADGRVVVWDARPVEKRDEAFERVADLTAQACAAVGWEYAVFDSPEAAEQLNTLWLRNFRHAPGWPHHDLEIQLLRSASTPVTVGELIQSDEGDGHLAALMWHLLWTGELVTDLSRRITADTPVCASESTRA